MHKSLVIHRVDNAVEIGRRFIVVEERMQQAALIPAAVADRAHHRANGVGGITPTMKVAALAESFGMDCEVHGNGAASLAVVGAIRNCRWYERGLLHPFLDYDEPAAYLNSIVDPMDDQGCLPGRRLDKRSAIGYLFF